MYIIMRMYKTFFVDLQYVSVYYVVIATVYELDFTAYFTYFINITNKKMSRKLKKKKGGKK